MRDVLKREMFRDFSKENALKMSRNRNVLATFCIVLRRKSKINSVTKCPTMLFKILELFITFKRQTRQNLPHFNFNGFRQSSTKK